MTKVYFWTDGPLHYWATENPFPYDPNPSLPAGPFTVLQEAYDDALTFVNGPFYPLFDRRPERFPSPAE
jgi:hypothetical protein